MVMLTFNTKMDELLRERKLQTIRANPDRWEKMKIGTTLHIWWLNPRNRHKDCGKLGIAELVSVLIKEGCELTNEDAIKDGFKDLNELIFVLCKLNKMPLITALLRKWAIITWRWKEKEWKKGDD